MKIKGSLQTIEIATIDLEYEVRHSTSGKLSLYLSKNSYRKLLGAIMLQGLALEDLGVIESEQNTPQQEIEIS